MTIQNQNQNVYSDDQQNIQNQDSASNNANVVSNNDDTSNDANQHGDIAQGDEDRIFSQDDVTKMMAREKQQGRSSAYNKLGIDPNNADMVAKVQEFVKSLAPHGDEAVAAAEQRLREAEAKVKVAETKAELLQAGIVTNYVDDAMVLVNAKLDKETDIVAAIGELKKKFPVWFTTTNQGAQQFRGTGSNPKSQEGGSVGDDKGSLGKRLAASKKNSQPKRSYFDRK